MTSDLYTAADTHSAGAGGGDGMSLSVSPADGSVEPVAAAGLQTTFDDLYTAVYALIDDAKRDHELVKLYKGSHAATDPHPRVGDFGSAFFRNQRGLFAYTAHSVTDQADTPTPADLDTYDTTHQPRVRVRSAFDLLATSTSRRSDESDQDFLTYLVSRRHELARYRGGSSGYDDEARAFAAAHFRTTGVPSSPDEVLISCGGAKGVFLAFCAAVMCRHESEQVHRMSGRLLAPAGYYQSLRVVPPIFGGTIEVTSELTGSTVAAWLSETATVRGRAIYVPLVNNLDGSVLDRGRAHAIAAAILEHNHRQPHNPVLVLGDDVYAGSYLTGSGTEPTPIGAVTGDDLAAPELGSMTDWTVSVVTPSKTFALPTSRVAYATSGNTRLRAALQHYRTMLSHGRVPQGDELTGIAAICLTPQAWIDGWNATYTRRAQWLTNQLAAINHDLGMPAFHASVPQGGWYAALSINPALFDDTRVRSSIHALAVCLYYGRHRADTGIGVLPGELAGYRAAGGSSPFVLRANLAVSDAELTRFVTRLRELGTLLRGPDAAGVINHALQRARAVVELDASVP